jgi:hypothetical protein
MMKNVDVEIYLNQLISFFDKKNIAAILIAVQKSKD